MSLWGLNTHTVQLRTVFSEPALFHAGWEPLLEPTLFHAGRNHYFTEPTLFHAGRKDHTSSSEPGLFHARRWDLMPVNDYPLLSHSVMLTITRIEFVNHQSLLRGTTPSLSLKYSNFTLDNDLVNTFATCSSVATYWSFTTPFSTISRIYWYLISMCLDLSWNTGFSDNFMQL